MAINEGIDHFYADLRLSKGIQVLTDSEIAYKLHKNMMTKEKITESPKFLPLLIKHIELEKEIIWIKRDKNKWADLMTRIGLSADKQLEIQKNKLEKEGIELVSLEEQELYPEGPRIRNRERITNPGKRICQLESKSYKKRKKSSDQHYGKIPNKRKRNRNRNI